MLTELQEDRIEEYTSEIRLSKEENELLNRRI
jgi:hypothetical protein